MTKPVPAGRTDWKALMAMTDEEITANALSDPDCPPITHGRHIPLRPEDGKTLLERLRKALERERKFPSQYVTMPTWCAGTRPRARGIKPS